MPEANTEPAPETPAPAEGEPPAVDLAALAERLVRQLREELRIERERRGPDPGRRMGG